MGGELSEPSFRSLWQASAVRRSEPSRFTLLVVDDFDDARLLYAMFFEELGFNVIEASDGQEALAKVAEQRPDLVVMDVAMPRMDGISATSALKGDVETSRIPIVVLTGNVHGAALDRARASGANAVLTKPCTPLELGKTVIDLLSATA